ncbi:MAG: hypothetical protein ACLRIL_07905 [Fusicatenibacter saccharivorans]
MEEQIRPDRQKSVVIGNTLREIFPVAACRVPEKDSGLRRVWMAFHCRGGRGKGSSVDLQAIMEAVGTEVKTVSVKQRE